MAEHKNALKQLTPLDFDGVFSDDLAVEGQQIDNAESIIKSLLLEMFPDTATLETIGDWERMFDITPDAGDTLQSRRDVVSAHVRALGGLSKPYFISLMAALGETATITEYQPFRVGVSRVGERIYQPDIVFAWNITFTGWTGNIRQEAVEKFVNELKPAHTMVSFTYN